MLCWQGRCACYDLLHIATDFASVWRGLLLAADRADDARYLSFNLMAQCSVHALNGLACHARIWLACLPHIASSAQRSRRLRSTRLRQSFSRTLRSQKHSTFSLFFVVDTAGACIPAWRNVLFGRHFDAKRSLSSFYPSLSLHQLLSLPRATITKQVT